LLGLTGVCITVPSIKSRRTLTTFASGLYYPDGLAFNSAGQLFESNYGTDSINEFTPDGVQTTFASGLLDPIGLAFQPVPEPSALALAGLGAAAALPSPPVLGTSKNRA